MARSGARLREVGATNRTIADDYRAALDECTAALLKVYPSNFTVSGYTAAAAVEDLAIIAREAGVPLLHDIGSGLLLEPDVLGLPADEPTPRTSLAAGADVVTMSGDKLLGGPQCGILLGTVALIERMRRNPLCRALRVDKLTIAGLTATLRLHLDPDGARRDIPVLRMLTLDADTIAARAGELASACAAFGDVQVIDGLSAVGGGAAAAAELPTRLVLLRPSGMSAHELERRLRAGAPPVIARMVAEGLALDVRTIDPQETPALLSALAAAVDS
jgi:L-seryl-tRNA(Ser) seleniumtransferase